MSSAWAILVPGQIFASALSSLTTAYKTARVPAL